MIPLKDDIPVSRPPLVTMALIAANVAAFCWQVLAVGLPRSVQLGGLVPAELLTLRDLAPPDLVPPPLTVLTSMFLHGGLLHLLGNMLFLWIFGNNVEDALGRGRFVAFYLACGVAAALAQAGAAALGSDPDALFIPMVGASGAIAGVLAAYLRLYPHARVLTLVPIFVLIRLVYIPASFFIGLWFLLQLFSAFFGAAGSGVAFTAHVGGFVAGWLFLRRAPRRPVVVRRSW